MDRKIILLLQPHFDASAEVFNLLVAAVESAGIAAEVDFIPLLQEVYRHAGDQVVDRIRKADVIVANLDGGNASVFFSLGAAVSQAKPIVLIAPAGRAISVPEGFESHRLYLFSEEKAPFFVAALGEALRGALGQQQVDSGVQSTKVFISYCRKDDIFLQRLLVHLRPLERARLIDVWDDTKLRAGDRWEDEIKTALEKAHAAILLVSADFLASDFIVNNELPPLLSRAAAEGTRIIPVIVKPCRFSRDPNLASFHAINDPARSLIELDEAGRERVFDKVASEVEGVL